MIRLNYYNALTQVIIVGFVCFLCPGMFNAVNGLGAGGQLDASASNNANTALYSTFVVFGVMGGAFVNLCGVRYTIFCSGFAYALYSGSYLFLNHHPDNSSFSIAAGALLGVGAGILWAAQGMIMTSYPREEEKAKYIAVFWVIFNLGGMLGGILPFAINYHKDSGSNADGVYIAFVVLECLGACLGLALAPPSKVVRDDGSSVMLVKYTNVWREALEVVKLFFNPMMLGLLPMCFTSNFFYTYQFNHLNAGLFNLRTRGFNNMFYWGFQMLGAYLFSLLLDNSKFSRRKRGLIAFGIVFLFFNSIWGGSLALRLKYPKDRLPADRWDFKDSKNAAGPMILYMICGVADALYQSLAYWIIGALSNDNQKLSRYAGFYKGIQSFGAAIAWQLDVKVTPRNQLIANWVLFGASIPPMLFVIWFLKDHNEDIPKPSDASDEAYEEKTTA
ncbi:major facilitator superfamily domain-containing protein [Coemansia spiralis]|nr:major facilitator superfamily domain-containing protein [Coemansia spiralis]